MKLHVRDHAGVGELDSIATVVSQPEQAAQPDQASATTIFLTQSTAAVSHALFLERQNVAANLVSSIPLFSSFSEQLPLT